LTALSIALGWGTLAQANPQELVDAAADHGFDSVTVSPAACLRWVEAGGSLDELRTQAARRGVRVAAVDALIAGLPGVPAVESVPPEFRDAFVAREIDCHRILAATGARRLNVAHFLGHDTPLPELAAAIGTLCRRLAPLGCTLSIEFIPGTGIPDLATAEKLRQIAGEPNLGVLLDTWHFVRSGGTVEDIRFLPRGAVAALQLSDRVPPAPGAVYRPMAGRLLPGHGTLPLAAILAAALANNPGLDVELEVFSAELRSRTPRAAAALVRTSLQSWERTLPAG
jgi:sugar phosphate isomerase/epimerase